MSTTTVWAPRPTEPSARWVVAKWVVLLSFVVAVAGSIAWPDVVARIVWFVVVPLLPATFLLNAELWRNVCPLATLNTLASNRDGGRPLNRRTARIATVLGIGLLLLAIPARQVVFNESGLATGFLMGAAGLLALLSGIPLQRKAGFCNSVCPILPIERLYGQRPLLVTENARCTPCHVCTRAACFDLNPGRSALQTLRAGSTKRSWVLLPFGVFALAFPGVIIGYYLAPQLPIAGALGPYAAIWAIGASSWMLAAGLATATKIRPAGGLLWAALLSVGLYYWFTPIAVAESFAWPAELGMALRAIALTLVAIWGWRALKPSDPTGRRSRRRLPVAPAAESDASAAAR